MQNEKPSAFAYIPQSASILFAQVLRVATC